VSATLKAAQPSVPGAFIQAAWFGGNLGVEFARGSVNPPGGRTSPTGQEPCLGSSAQELPPRVGQGPRADDGVGLRC